MQEAAARNVGRTIHPAFQRKAMPAMNAEAPSRSAVPVELPAEPALPPVHILQVSSDSYACLHQQA